MKEAISSSKEQEAQYQASHPNLRKLQDSGFRDILGQGGVAGPSGSLGELGVGIIAGFGPFPHGESDKEVGAWPEQLPAFPAEKHLC